MSSRDIYDRGAGGDLEIDYPDLGEVSRRLGEVIRRARHDLDLSISALARVTGVSRRTIRDIENDDETLPTISTLLRISRPLGLTLEGIGRQIDPDDSP